MSFSVSDGGMVERLIERLERMRSQAHDLEVPLTRSGVFVRDEAVMRIQEQGGDQPWAPSPWKTGQLGVISGRMRSSLSVDVAGPNLVQVGTNVMSESGVSYPYLFQYGSGIYAGHSAWTVRPVRAKALRFFINGEPYFANEATISGQPPRPFLVISDAARVAAAEELTTWIFG